MRRRGCERLRTGPTCDHDGAVPEPPAMTAEAVLLVGHGAVPKDAPRELVTELKQLEKARRGTPEPPSAREVELDRTLREWPRNERNDPYRAGLLRAAEALRARVAPVEVEVAFNEFCAPSIRDAVDRLVADRVKRIRVISAMVTPGGNHSEVDIPEELAAARKRHPSVAIDYLWPVDPELLGDFFARLLEQPSGSTPGS
jgi:sirohydrochlorin cobaltochelatase